MVYEIDGADTADRPRSLCIAVGGVLRVRNVGPEELTATPPGLAVCRYEAGIYNCQLVETGTVSITLTYPSAHTIRVVVR
ncbi:hypothetical protein E1166_20060 [Micromonospora sp. KC213]|nr:hypothetical protein E1166_20060 [Micromonospora sp. KC213]